MILHLQNEASSDTRLLAKQTGNQSIVDTESILPEDALKELQKLAQIATIVELMEENHKDKDWLVDQIKQKRQRIAIRAGLSTVGILKMCSSEFISNALSSLKTSEISDIDNSPPPITVSYHWFFTDIVAGSDPTITTNEQARKIILLNKLVERTDVFKQRDSENTLVLPTGDGMAIGFSDSPEKPLNLAIEVHKGLKSIQQAAARKRPGIP